VIARRSRRAARAIRRPAWIWRVHPWLVAGARRGAGPARRRPVLAPSAGRSTRTMTSRTRVARAGAARDRAVRTRVARDRAVRDRAVRDGAGGAQDFRDGRAARPAGGGAVPRNVNQAARGVHVRGVHHRPTGGTRRAVPGGPGGPGVPARLRGLRAGRFLAMPGRDRPGLGPAGSPGPADGEKHQDHQAGGDSGRDDVQPYPGQVGRRDRRVPGDVPQDHARRHEEGADHHRRGSRNRQEEDETHPPGSGGMGAHWSTIASRLPARKPNG
jgi:hypothetical protein